jgi:hypothetical protein
LISEKLGPRIRKLGPRIRKLGPRIREKFFPPEPDKLFVALDATSPNEHNAVNVSPFRSCRH